MGLSASCNPTGTIIPKSGDVSRSSYVATSEYAFCESIARSTFTYPDQTKALFHFQGALHAWTVRKDIHSVSGNLIKKFSPIHLTKIITV